MTVVKVVVGVAGSGKTSKAMEIIEQKLKEGLKWNQIGFCSFSRAACFEAARRASVITGVEAERLKTEGHFKTLHAMAYRGLGLDSKMIIDHDSKSGRDFVAECCGLPRGGEKGTLGDKIDQALTAWDTARARLSRFVDPDLSHGNNPAVTATPDCCGQKTQQIRGVSHAVTPCHTRAVPVFFDAEIEKSAKFDGFGPPINVYIEKNIAHKKNELCRCGNQKWWCKCDRDEKKGSYVGNILEFECHSFSDFAVTACDTCDKPEFQTIIRQFEEAKKYSGQLDFYDILLRFAGFEADSELMFRRCQPQGITPEGIRILMLDEYQDCSRLLDAVARRIAEGLSDCAGELWMLGDKYQSVYSFAGSDHRVFEAWENQAKERLDTVLLNRSYRNPQCVIDWGEEVLREDEGYEERRPWSDKEGGSVGMMEMGDFMSCLPQIAATDSMVLSRTWFGLNNVKARLAELCVPWVSCQEKQSSPWDAPVKIAIVLTMQDLRDGKKISEQDFRRLTENFPQKLEGQDLFRRGEKARWKKMECSGDLDYDLKAMNDLGAGDGFVNFVIEEKWRKDQLLLISVAIAKFGIDAVRKPTLKLGSCHSVKGMQAENVFCLATSSEKASQSGFYEDLFLKYVTITRASINYRVVVDRVDHAKGRRLFLPCPKNYWSFQKGLPDGFGEKHSVPNHQDAEQTPPDMGGEVPRDPLFCERSSGSDRMLQGEVLRDGSQDAGRNDNDDPAVPAENDFEEWWNL